MNSDSEVFLLFQFTTAVLYSVFHGRLPSLKRVVGSQSSKTLFIFQTMARTNNIINMNTQIPTNNIVLINPFKQTSSQRMNDPTITNEKL